MPDLENFEFVKTPLQSPQPDFMQYQLHIGDAEARHNDVLPVGFRSANEVMDQPLDPKKEDLKEKTQKAIDVMKKGDGDPRKVENGVKIMEDFLNAAYANGIREGDRIVQSVNDSLAKDKVGIAIALDPKDKDGLYAIFIRGENTATTAVKFKPAKLDK